MIYYNICTYRRHIPPARMWHQSGTAWRFGVDVDYLPIFWM